MSSTLHHKPHAGESAGHPHHGTHSPAAAAPAQPSGKPAGIFAPGTKVQVGSSRVVVERYLSEGGFAHVYLVKPPKPIGGEDIAVLKRVAVPDKEALANMRTEVETMKKLRGHRHIVTYFDSHASQLQGGGYEVFVLMEYCSGGGLIDFMNTRLQNRLTEPEILKIFSDTAQGVACMHYLKPPLLHRDLKVENILISSVDGAKQFKLCDFGSAAAPRPAATSAAEGRLIEDDVQRHTTMQYRSPEMIDVYRKHPIDEKSDIWALGVFLYKLCYYTTPFEEQGQMAILNASFKFPGYPHFSDRLKRLIAIMLQEQPSKRPNIYQVLKEVCSMRGTEVPIKDIYSSRTASEARRNQELPLPPGDVKSPPTVGAVKVAPVEEKKAIPEITPMRRGRPTKSDPAQDQAPRPSPSPGRVIGSDPFAALDSNGQAGGNGDELASRFPTLDQFSLLHESGNKFSFDSKQTPQPPPPSRDLSQRVTEALADDAFAVLKAPTEDRPPQSKSKPALAGKVTTGTQTSFDAAAAQRAANGAAAQASMVSTGTMTSPSNPPADFIKASPSLRSNFRFQSSDHRASSQPRQAAQFLHEHSPSGREGLLARPSLQDYRSQSQTKLEQSQSSPSMWPTSNSPRTAAIDIDSPALPELPERTNTSRAKSRPASGTFESAAKFFQSRGSPRVKSPETLVQPTPADLNSIAFDTTDDDSSRIGSNVDFLRAMEEEESAKSKREKRRSTGSTTHSKRSSMPSISLSGTKNLLAGRFGEAFKRFETNAPQAGAESPDVFLDSTDLTPIAGSEATDGRSDDGNVLEETEEMPPEMRRELERRRLSQEEKRVADAAAAYKQKVAAGGKAGAGGGIGGGPGAATGAANGGRAIAIQSKVQALLVESGKISPTRTAEGYGRFTHEPRGQQLQDAPIPTGSAPPPATAPKPLAARTAAASAGLPSRTASLPNRRASKSAIAAATAGRPAAAGAANHSGVSVSATASAATTASGSGGGGGGGSGTATSSSASVPKSAVSGRAVPASTGGRPPGPKPKPQALRTGHTGGGGNAGPAVAAKPSNLAGAGTGAGATRATAVAGTANAAHSVVPGTSPGPLTATRTRPGDANANGGRGVGGAGVGNGTGGGNAAVEGEDWEAAFTKKYPSLSGLEMVETEIEPTGAAAGGERGWRDI